MNWIERNWKWFKTLRKSRQFILMTSLLVLISIPATFTFWSLSPSYGVLFNHLDSRDANNILTQLEASNIAYQVRNHGQDILIDKQLIDKTRIKLMASPLQLTHRVGFELFDKTDFGMTDFSQKINYQRALQGELERTISSLEEIQQARVQLTIPEHHLFQQNNNLARAAVTLHLIHPLTTHQVRSIQQLICASVEHLTPEHVVIVDQNGNGLIHHENDASSSHFSAKKETERYLTHKVMQILHPVFHGKNVMVNIDVTLNYDELQRERIQPQQDGRITHEKESRHSTGNKADKTPMNQEITSEKSYQFGQEKEQFKRANGTIERLTVSVVLPQNTPKEKIKQIEHLVKSVIGFDENRGDTISIEALIATTSTPVLPSILKSIKPIHTHRLHTTEILSFNAETLKFGFAGLSLLMLSTLGFRLHLRRKRRRLLLAELNEWLVNHD